MKIAIGLTVTAALTSQAIAGELSNESSGNDYLMANEAEQSEYAYYTSTRLNKTSAKWAINGEEFDGCLRGKLIETEEGQERAHDLLMRTRLGKIALQCALEVNQPAEPK